MEGIQHEVELLPRVAREERVAHGHRGVALRDQVAQRVVVALALAHRRPVDQQVLAVVPVARECRPVAALALRDLVFVVGEEKVHAARVEVDRLPKVLLDHRAALDVPARAPSGGSARPGPLNVAVLLGLEGLPEGEVADVVLVVGVKDAVRHLELALLDA